MKEVDFGLLLTALKCSVYYKLIYIIENLSNTHEIHLTDFGFMLYILLHLLSIIYSFYVNLTAKVKLYLWFFIFVGSTLIMFKFVLFLMIYRFTIRTLAIMVNETINNLQFLNKFAKNKETPCIKNKLFLKNKQKIINSKNFKSNIEILNLMVVKTSKNLQTSSLNDISSYQQNMHSDENIELNITSLDKNMFLKCIHILNKVFLIISFQSFLIIRKAAKANNRTN